MQLRPRKQRDTTHKDTMRQEKLGGKRSARKNHGDATNLTGEKQQLFDSDSEDDDDGKF